VLGLLEGERVAAIGECRMDWIGEHDPTTLGPPTPPANFGFGVVGSGLHREDRDPSGHCAGRRDLQDGRQHHLHQQPEEIRKTSR
jgi:hypothetical protein